MRKNILFESSKFILFLLMISVVSLGFIEGDKRGTVTTKTYSLGKTTSGKVGDAYRMNINNINMPINRVGTTAAVNIPPDGTLGRFGNSSFLFSGGFFMSGYTNGTLWSFAQASASLVENMVPGTPASGPNDPDAVMYVLKREDPPFSQSWIDWKTAVDKFGADFYDGDGDGQYNPVDKNGNGEWDADEDHPDLLGDETAWCVYTDGQPGAQRTRFAGVNPQGVEIRQTVFAYASKGPLGNMIFIRYRLKNSGVVANTLDSVYFGAWADPDLGAEHEDDLVGIDVPRNAGYTYNGDDNDAGGYGKQVPCFMIDFFLGPIAYVPGETFTDNNGNGSYDEGIDQPITTGYSYRGQLLGIKEFPGAKNLPSSSFVHYQNGDPSRGDPNTEFEARNYMEGRLKLGELIDPCNDPRGEVKGVSCSSVDPRFWYSGDPVEDIGWLNNFPTDQRQMTNVGPFQLKAGEEIEVVVAYVVGQGTDQINSITVAREIDDGAQFVFDGNFRAPVPPPSIEVTVESGPDFIDLLFPAHKQFSFVDSTTAWVDKFQGINVYAYRTNSTQSTVSGQTNEVLYKTFQTKNFIKNVFKENAVTGGKDLLYSESTNRLDSIVYADQSRSLIRVRITDDPITGGKLIKGKPYYFALTSYALNHLVLAPMDTALDYGAEGDYYLSLAGFATEVENVPKIITVVLGEDIYSPPFDVIDGNKTAGGSNGLLQYDIVEKDLLTGDKYSISFDIDSTTVDYSTIWTLKNENSGVVFPSSKMYLYGSTEVSEVPTEGFIVKLSDEIPDSITITANTTADWSDANIYYLAKDLGDDSRKLPGGGTQLQNAQNTYTKADKLRRVVLKFGQTGKAYRYLNGFVGANPPARNNSYVYAGGVTADNPLANFLTEIGKLGEGYVDVPFTAWVEDEAFGEIRQLAVGFLERRKTGTTEGNPDGVWDPGTNVNSSGEYIFIFNQSYDPNGGQIEYQGNFPASSVVWADLKGYTIPTDAAATPDQRKIAASAFFDVLYTAAISRADTLNFWSAGDEFVIEIDKYPYTPADKFEFQTRKSGTLTEAEEKALFEKVNVYPNPLYGFNEATSYTNSAADEPFVTFSNLPEEVTIKIYSLSGQLLRTLGVEDKSSPTSPFLRWNLQNESGLRAASGMYLAIVSSPKYGDKVLKFAIIMPQKQIQKF